MDNNMIDSKIAALKTLEEQMATLKKEVDSIKDELKAELDSRKEDSINTGLHKIFYSCYNKTVVDTDKLKAAKLFDNYSKVSTCTQFKITDVKVQMQ